MGRYSRARRKNFRRTLFAKLGLDPDYRKVFAIGFNKTATTSIAEVLSACGLFTAHDIFWRDTDSLFYHWRYQGFTDGPPDNFVTLDRRFAKSRFILNTRDLSEWLDSRLAHVEIERARGGDPHMDYWQTPRLAAKEWIKQRNHHHASVLRYFRDRPQDLLVINYVRDAEAPHRIADFVGRPRVVGRPHAHTLHTGRQHGDLRYGEIIEEALRSLRIPQSEWANDLLCPSLGGVAGLPADTSDLEALRIAAQ
ncbi:MAG: hypothetical protein ABL866_04030 [Devosia sp.]